MKNYQTAAGRAGTTGRTTPKKAKADPQRSAHEGAVALPDAVSVAVGELGTELEEGLLAFAVGAGLQVLGAILDAEVTALAGPKGRHDPQRSAAPRQRRRPRHLGWPPGVHHPAPGAHR
jgi:hypothetical protein